MNTKYAEIIAELGSVDAVIKFFDQEIEDLTGMLEDERQGKIQDWLLEIAPNVRVSDDQRACEIRYLEGKISEFRSARQDLLRSRQEGEEHVR